METKEQKERDFASGVEIVVSSVEVKTSSKVENEVLKVIFDTDKGLITHKPKITRTENRAGLLIKRQESCLVDDLPQIVFDIAKECNLRGKAIVKASYNIWNTIVDGVPQTYRFVQGKTMLDRWELVRPGVLQ